MNKMRSIFKKYVSKSWPRIMVTPKLARNALIFLVSAITAYIFVGLVSGRIAIPSISGDGVLSNKPIDSARSVFSNIRLPGFSDSPRSNQQKYADAWTVVSKIGSGDFDSTIVDMRSKDDYAKAHLQETVNIPFPYTIEDNTDVKSFVASVKKIQNKNKLILLPYSIFSKTGEEAQKALQKEGIHSLVLSAGWNELYNLPNIWVPELSWEDFSIIDLIDGVRE